MFLLDALKKVIRRFGKQREEFTRQMHKEMSVSPETDKRHRVKAAFEESKFRRHVPFESILASYNLTIQDVEIHQELIERHRPQLVRPLPSSDTAYSSARMYGA